MDQDSLESRARRAQAELERRLHAGEDCRAEEFFKADPDLAASVETAIDLIYAEFTAREEAGQKRDPEEYYQTYPQWREKLVRQFVIHEEMSEPPAVRTIRIRGPDGQPEQYQVLREISKSPNGHVYKARRSRDNRVVALKTFAGDEEADAVRFRTGAQEQQRLRHGNILPVHDVGESEEGLPCFVMEFAEGGSLDRQLAGKPQPADEAARLVRTLAEAMSYAHGEGVVHRDLKPANVVLTGDGTARITDFGLARRLDATGGPTISVEVLGTPAYMAPEQAAGRTRDVGPLSDVYSLGAILYELLTGRPPFQARTLVETLQQVLTRRPLRPRRLEKGVPPGLESVCLKCLEKKPRRRYQSAQELVDDLGRWLGHETPRSHRLSARAGRLIRWHPVLGATAALFLLAAVLGLSIAYLIDPTRIAERIEARLARGEEVTLVPEKGFPPYHSWVTREESQKDLLSTDGSFRIESESWAMKVLVRDPQSTSYRLSAHMRHDEIKELGGHAGIFFAYSRHATGLGVEHCFCKVGLNGITDFRKQLPFFEGNPVGLDVHRNAEPIPSPHVYAAGERAFVPISWEAAPVWITIVLDVSPDSMRFTILNENQPEKSVSREVAREEIEDAKVDVCNPKRAGPLEIDPALSPRGSLGIYTYRGSASFRNVVVTPKP
jgi:serine/threonine-protein kinase